MEGFNRMISKNKEDLIYLLIIFIIFGLFAFLAYFFPYTHDDWAWGSAGGIAVLESDFKSLNGRYIGHFLVLFLTRNNIAKTLVMAFSFTSIIILCSEMSLKNSKKKSVTLLLFPTMLFLFMSKEIFRQAIVWTSGFSNYVLCIFLVLTYIFFIKNIFNDKLPSYNKYFPLLALFIGFYSCLFMEHVTLYSVFIGISVVFYSLYRFKKVFFMHIAYLIGSTVGAILMFSNPVYGFIQRGKDGYRSTAFSDSENNLFTMIEEHLGIIVKQLFLDNLLLFFILSLILLVLVLFQDKNRKILLVSSELNILCFIVLCLKHNSYKNDCFGLFFMLIPYLGTLMLNVFFLLIDSKRKKLLTLLYLSVFVLLAPLLVVNPIEARTFFAPYIIFVIICSIFMQVLMERLKQNERIQSAILGTCFVLTIFAFFFYLNIYSTIHKYAIARNAIAVEQAKKSDIVTFYKLPYSSFVWERTPGNEYSEKAYKAFYGIPQDVKFEYKDYREMELLGD